MRARHNAVMLNAVQHPPRRARTTILLAAPPAARWILNQVQDDGALTLSGTGTRA
jgi:hypothetical protein